MKRHLFALSTAFCSLAACMRPTAVVRDEGFEHIRMVRGVPLAPSVTCASSDCRTYNVLPYVRARTRYGIGCLGNVPPGSTPNPEPPPQSFSVLDIGKPGVRHLNAAEQGLVERVQRFIHSKTLRIAWVDGSTTSGGFVVFDAIDGPCYGGAGGYSVLNGSCNEFYEPGENPYHTMPAPSCFPSSRPWLVGRGKKD